MNGPFFEELYGSIGGYRLERMLGRGASGEVWEARSPYSGEQLALKRMELGHMTTKERELATQEAQLLRRLAHPHIVRFVDLIADQHQICIVMQFLDGGDLTKVIRSARDIAKRLPEADIWRWFLQVTSALMYLHKAGIIHRDVKPANIFLTAGNTTAVLGDLGIAKVLQNEKSHAVTQIGTPAYLSPEVWQGRTYSFAADIYSLGCTIYELAELRMPFVAHNRGLLAAQVCSKSCPPISDASGYSRVLRDVVQLMLDKDPSIRPGASKIMSYAKNIAAGSGRKLGTPSGGTSSKTRVSPRGQSSKQRNSSPDTPGFGKENQAVNVADPFYLGPPISAHEGNPAPDDGSINSGAAQRVPRGLAHRQQIRKAEATPSAISSNRATPSSSSSAVRRVSPVMQPRRDIAAISVALGLPSPRRKSIDNVPEAVGGRAVRLSPRESISRPSFLPQFGDAAVKQEPPTSASQRNGPSPVRQASQASNVSPAPSTSPTNQSARRAPSPRLLAAGISAAAVAAPIVRRDIARPRSRSPSSGHGVAAVRERSPSSKAPQAELPKVVASVNPVPAVHAAALQSPRRAAVDRLRAASGSRQASCSSRESSPVSAVAAAAAAAFFSEKRTSVGADVQNLEVRGCGGWGDICPWKDRVPVTLFGNFLANEEAAQCKNDKYEGVLDDNKLRKPGEQTLKTIAHPKSDEDLGDMKSEDFELSSTEIVQGILQIDEHSKPNDNEGKVVVECNAVLAAPGVPEKDVPTSSPNPDPTLDDSTLKFLREILQASSG